MQVFLILALIIAFFAVVFTLQNMTPVTVVFLVWTFHGSLALVLFIFLAMGALISIFASLPALIRAKWAASTRKKKILELEASLEDRMLRHQEKSEKSRIEGKSTQSAALPIKGKEG